MSIPKFESGAWVYGPSGEKKRVKNLGWLRSNWKEIGSFEVFPHEKGGGDFPEAWLAAKNREGHLVYSTEFASLSVLRAWLHRPIFRGLPLRWLGTLTEC